ncbi:MAG: universal stress protein [Burkholderiaceae bacterium]
MYRRILVTTGGGELSSKAVKAALRLARDFDSTVIALNVQSPYQPPIAGEVPATFAHNPDEYDEMARANSRKILDQVEETAKGFGVDCQTITVFDQSVHQAVIRVAKDERIDLIVMASHGRSGIKSLILGSETQKVLSSCMIPVLVHR